MISRRSFLAALSCLPFVGKMIPQQTPKMIPLVMEPMGEVWYSAEPLTPFSWDDPFIVPSWDEVQRDYAAKYGASDAFMHPEMRADIERLQKNI